MKKVSLGVTVLLLLVATMAFAQIPRAINYQGKLTNDLGVAQNGNFDIVFRIFDSELGIVPLWEESHSAASAINIVNGLFDVQLGAITPLTIAFDDTYWIELQVGTETLTPRERLVAVPYAFRAIVADTARTIGSGVVQTDGITIIGDGVLPNPIKVKDSGITGTQINSSVAGNGLAGGAGSPLSVNPGNGIQITADQVETKVDNKTIEIGADGALRQGNGAAKATSPSYKIYRNY